MHSALTPPVPGDHIRTMFYDPDPLVLGRGQRYLAIDVVRMTKATARIRINTIRMAGTLPQFERCADALPKGHRAKVRIATFVRLDKTARGSNTSTN